MKPKYEKIGDLNKAQIEAAILRDDTLELRVAVLSEALQGDDPAWAEDVCVRLSTHNHPNVRGNAILGFGHIARIHGRLTKDRVKPLIEAALEDRDEFVRGHADSAKEDTIQYLKWRFKRKKELL